MTQEDLAHAAGVSVKTISRFENGHHDGRRATLKRIAQALEVEEQDITGPPPAPLGLGQDAAADRIDAIERTVDTRFDEIGRQLQQVLETVAEPAYGTGGFLVGALKSLEIQAGPGDDDQESGAGASSFLVAGIGRMLEAHTARVEALVAQQNGLLARQSKVLEDIQALLDTQLRTASKLEEWAEQAVKALPDEPSPASTTGPTRKSPASG